MEGQRQRKSREGNLKKAGAGDGAGAGLLDGSGGGQGSTRAVPPLIPPGAAPRQSSNGSTLVSRSGYFSTYLGTRRLMLVLTLPSRAGAAVRLQA